MENKRNQAQIFGSHEVKEWSRWRVSIVIWYSVKFIFNYQDKDKIANFKWTFSISENLIGILIQVAY